MFDEVMTSQAFKIPPHIKGLIFDCDGTIADTMPLHFQAYKEALGSDGSSLTEELFFQQAGVPAETFLEILRKTYNLDFDPDQVAEQKETLFGNNLHQVESIKAVEQIVRDTFGKMPMAVASGGTRENVKRTLELLEMLDFFGTFVTTEDVENGKPAPDIFLEAARRIGIPPGQCMVFEDGDKGIEAAVAAGMEWVDVRGWS